MNKKTQYALCSAIWGDFNSLEYRQYLSALTVEDGIKLNQAIKEWLDD